MFDEHIDDYSLARMLLMLRGVAKMHCKWDELLVNDPTQLVHLFDSVMFDTAVARDLSTYIMATATGRIDQQLPLCQPSSPATTALLSSVQNAILDWCQHYGVGTLPTPPTTPPQPKTVETFTVNSVSFEMIRIEGGTFMMGATAEQGSYAEDNEKPAHQVTLSDYYIGKYQVTDVLWQAVMEDNPSHFKGDLQSPVVGVSWNDCQEFIKKLNHLTGMTFRLPTEAQWEYAARGGNKSQGYKYSGSNNIDEVAWYAEGFFPGSNHPVGEKQPNELGLYDMSGNVNELCQDWFGDYSSDAQTNPEGPSSGEKRVYRGGCSRFDESACRVSC